MPIWPRYPSGCLFSGIRPQLGLYNISLRFISGPKLLVVSREFRRGVTTATVRCGLSGSITVDLHNIDKHPLTAPLIIYLPPCPNYRTSAGRATPIPDFLNKYPVAVINYRWSELDFGHTGHKKNAVDPLAPGKNLEVMDHPEVQVHIGTGSKSEAGVDSDGAAIDKVISEEEIDEDGTEHLHGNFPNPTHWPTPVHDTAFGYQWIVSALSPTGYSRRDIYLYGTHLGANLAASLALTESYPQRRVAVRGVAAYNGIYNWSMFLPGHTIYKSRSRSKVPRAHQFRVPPEGTWLHYLWTKLEALFGIPGNMFDPFASPGLFFHNPGMLVPIDFRSDVPAASELIHPAIMDHLAEGHPAAEGVPGSPAPSLFYTIFRRPRKANIIYPPSHSAVRIPDSIFLHDSSPGIRPHVPAHSEQIDSFLDRYGRHHQARRRRMSLRALRRLPAPPKPTASFSGKEPVIDNTLAGHALELARQMRKSVAKYEFKDKLRYAQSWEVEKMAENMAAEAENRVKTVDVGPAPAPAPSPASDLEANEKREKSAHSAEEKGEPVSNTAIPITPAAATRWLRVSDKVEKAVSLWLEERIDDASQEKEQDEELECVQSWRQQI